MSQGCSGLDDGETYVSAGTVSKAAVGMSGRHKQMMGCTEKVMVMQYERREAGTPCRNRGKVKNISGLS